MKKTTQGALVGAMALTATACGSDPFDRSIELSAKIIDIACSCPEAVGATSESACRAEREIDEWTDAEEACARRVYDAHQAELEPIFDCNGDRTDRFVQCLEAGLAQCPPSAADVADLEACGDTYESSANTCATVSTQTSTELNACFASRG